MTIIGRLRTMNRLLRVLLIASALLVVAQFGQFMAIHDINTLGHESDLAIFFMFLAVFVVPTSLILTTAVIYSARMSWREHELLVFLGSINSFIALNLVWFFVHQCSWSHVFSIALAGCAK